MKSSNEKHPLTWSSFYDYCWRAAQLKFSRHKYLLSYFSWYNHVSTLPNSKSWQNWASLPVGVRLLLVTGSVSEISRTLHCPGEELKWKSLLYLVSIFHWLSVLKIQWMKKICSWFIGVLSVQGCFIVSYNVNNVNNRNAETRKKVILYSKWHR